MLSIRSLEFEVMSDGAAALILMYTMNTTSSPFTLDQYNTLPKGAKSIPLAIFGSESSLANDNYEIIVH